METYSSDEVLDNIREIQESYLFGGGGGDQSIPLLTSVLEQLLDKIDYLENKIDSLKIND